jgi:hypothetical protein
MASAFDELLDLARRLGVVVRHARLGGSGGGLAKIRGTRQLFIDVDAGPEDQLEQTVRALARLEEIDAVFVRPDVREMIDEARREG